jgi:hypothetical protein
MIPAESYTITESNLMKYATLSGSNIDFTFTFAYLEDGVFVYGIRLSSIIEII